MSPAGAIADGVFEGIPMNRVLLSLCLLGAGLATANIIIMKRSTCSSSGTEAVAAYKVTSPPVVVPMRGKPAQAPKAGADKPAPAQTADPAQTKPVQTPKAATTKPAAQLKDSDRTGSINQKTKKPNGEESASVSQRPPAEFRDRQAQLYKRRYEPRRYDWRRHYRYMGPPVYIGPPVGFAIRVYPGW
jgi:hypothetical protein